MRKRASFLLIVSLVSFISTCGMFYVFEKGLNPGVRNFLDAVWWWFVTSATVGYGDIVPVTTAGRIVAVATIVTGFFIFASLVAIVAESVHAILEKKVRGTGQVTAENHIVICEYTAIADEIIQSMPQCSYLGDRKVVIVSDLVTTNPYPQHEFVCGVPINPAVLKRANVPKADVVFIFANLRFTDPDIKTMHVASRVMDLAPQAKLLVEMINPSHELLSHMPSSVIPMDSRMLMQAIIRDRKISPAIWEDLCKKAGMNAGNKTGESVTGTDAL